MTYARLNLLAAIKQGLQCRTGNEFQSTAQGILRHRIPGFQAVLPYGADGDGGNDGYSRSQGVYVQIHAPSSPRQTIRGAARKAVNDFLNIRRSWEKVARLKEYWFVSNSAGTNIHVENALSQIQREHGVKTRFLGSVELADEAAKLSRSDLEALMGFAVIDGSEASSDELDMLSSITADQLGALHLLTALYHPAPKRLCEELLPDFIEWKPFWHWLQKRGWTAKTDGMIELDEKVASQCRRNVVGQKIACEKWVEVLLGYGSVDCLYLSLSPMVTLGRLDQAIRTLAIAGLENSDAGWDKPLLALVEIFNKPKALRRVDRDTRITFQLAYAHLLARLGRNSEAFNVYRRCFDGKRRWPKHLHRAQMLLNWGVTAYRIGKEDRARDCYIEAMRLARARRDDFVWGRAATNLAQILISSDSSRAIDLVNQAEIAKKRAGDSEGLVVIAMVRGMIAAEKDDHTAAYSAFKTAKREGKRIGYDEVLIDVDFNLGKGSDESGKWALAAAHYRDSIREAEARRNQGNVARAQAALASVLYQMQDWKACQDVCSTLIQLPEEVEYVECRLTGLHGLLALGLKTNHPGREEFARQALDLAKRNDRQNWIGRILVLCHTMILG